MTDFIHFIGGKFRKRLLYAQNRQGVEISSRLLEGNSAKNCYMPKTCNAWTFHQLYSEKNIVLKAICNKTYAFCYSCHGNACASLPSAVTDFVTGSEPSFFLGCARDFQGKTFRPQVWKGLRVSEKNTHQEYFSNGPAAEQDRAER